MTPIRVVCQNTLNLALHTAKRSWATIHTGNIQNKLEEANQTLFLAEKYMDELGKEIEVLQRQKLSDSKVLEYIDILLPLTAEASDLQKKNVLRLQEEIKVRYFDAPDLSHVGKNVYRFINAVSDFATHAAPLRETANYRENLFSKTIEGNVLIDRAYQMIKATA